MLERAGVTVAVVDRWASRLAALRLDSDCSDTDLLGLIASLERVKDACAAVQARATHEYSERRLAALAPGSKPDRRARRDIAAAVARARGVSPTAGTRHLELSRMLVRDLPRILDAVAAGRTTEYRAGLVAHAAACLGTTDRAALDADLGPRLSGQGNRAVQAEADRIAAELDAAAVLQRHRLAARDRRVTLRPAPDTVTYLTALLPVTDGVATRAALDRHATAARAAGDRRSRGQIMADELTQRLLCGAAGHLPSTGSTPPTSPGGPAGRPTGCRVPAPDVGERAPAVAPTEHRGPTPDQRPPDPGAAAEPPPPPPPASSSAASTPTPPANNCSPPTPAADCSPRHPPLRPHPRPTLPHPLLRRPHPTHRPHHPPLGRRTHQPAQHRRTLRTPQPDQRSPHRRPSATGPPPLPPRSAPWTTDLDTHLNAPGAAPAAAAAAVAR